MAKIRVLIADDQRLVTLSFKALLEAECEDIEVVGLAHDGAEAVSLAESLKPDVALMDVRMPVMDGVEAARILRERIPETRVIMLTTFDDDEYVASAIRHGAAGYLLKDIATEELVSSIRSVSKGAFLLSRKAAESMAQGSHPRASGPAGPRAGPDPRLLDELSPRELTILKLVAQGQENKEIATALSMAEQSVKNAVSRIYQKLEVEGRSEARKLALGLGLVRRDPP
jgi:DNA-binding NarL/FixJ family response regulator